ncbi:hypothetical protein R6Z07M_002529 [Ovis aries]
MLLCLYLWDSLVAQRVQSRRARFNPWVKIPWRRTWQPTPIFLTGKSHGHRSLAGCSSWDHEELDTTEQLSMKLDPFQGLKVGSCLTLGNDLSEETHSDKDLLLELDMEQQTGSK